MKRILSSFLSVLMLSALGTITCDAKTSFINTEKVSVYKSRNGENICVQGEKLPPIYINNKNKAIANSYGGGSSALKTVGTLIKFIVGIAAVGYAVSLIKGLGKGLSTGMDSFISFLQNLSNPVNTTEDSKPEKQSGNQNDLGDQNGQTQKEEKTQSQDRSSFNFRQVFSLAWFTSLFSSFFYGDSSGGMNFRDPFYQLNV